MTMNFLAPGPLFAFQTAEKQVGQSSVTGGRKPLLQDPYQAISIKVWDSFCCSIGELFVKE